MMAPLSQPPPLPLPPPLVPPLQKSAQQMLCGTHCTLSHCLSALLISSIPAILLLLLAMLKTLRSCWRCGAVDAQRQQFGPPKQHRSRDRSLWLAALVSAGLLFVGAMASAVIGTLAEGPNRHRVPNAWLVPPVLEGMVAIVCFAILGGRGKHARDRRRERALIGVYALVQTIATIVCMLAFPPPAGQESAWVVATLWRVGACCALTLTSLWPNRAARLMLNSDDFLHQPPGTRSWYSERARQLLQSTEEEASAAASLRRSQQSMWAEWLSYSSVQPMSSNNGLSAGSSTSIDEGGSSSARPTHASEVSGCVPHTTTRPRPTLSVHPP